MIINRNLLNYQSYHFVDSLFWWNAEIIWGIVVGFYHAINSLRQQWGSSEVIAHKIEVGNNVKVAPELDLVVKVEAIV